MRPHAHNLFTYAHARPRNYAYILTTVSCKYLIIKSSQTLQTYGIVHPCNHATLCEHCPYNPATAATYRQLSLPPYIHIMHKTTMKTPLSCMRSWNRTTKRPCKPASIQSSIYSTVQYYTTKKSPHKSHTP
jgi:hypothetical protein